MLLRKKAVKIPCYVLIFDQTAIIQASLEFLAKYADRLELIVIENPSSHSAEIRPIVEQLGLAGLIKRYYVFSKNVTGMAFDLVIDNELDYIGASPQIMITDGDLTCQDSGWLDEELAILQNHPEVFACGVSLDKSNLPVAAFPDAVNWVPPDKQEYADYYEVCTGGHLLLMSGADMKGFMEWKRQNKTHFIDSNMHRYCYERLGRQWARTKRSKAYHLTWDLYQDVEHPYTQLKTGKSFSDTWLHNSQAPWTLIEY